MKKENAYNQGGELHHGRQGRESEREEERQKKKIRGNDLMFTSLGETRRLMAGGEGWIRREGRREGGWRKSGRRGTEGGR